MIKLILILFFIPSTVFANSIIRPDSQTLEIKIQDKNIEVILPTVAHTLLTKWNPKFEVFSLSDYSQSVLQLIKDLGTNEAPIGFVEDLDGNGRKDIVLIGSDRFNQYAIAIIRKENQWTLLQLKKWSIQNITKTHIPNFKVASQTVQTPETGIPIYVLKAIGKQGDYLKAQNKIGIQIEEYFGPSEVFEIKDGKALPLEMPKSGKN